MTILIKAHGPVAPDLLDMTAECEPGGCEVRVQAKAWGEVEVAFGIPAKAAFELVLTPAAAVAIGSMLLSAASAVRVAKDKAAKP